MLVVVIVVGATVDVVKHKYRNQVVVVAVVVAVVVVVIVIVVGAFVVLRVVAVVFWPSSSLRKSKVPNLEDASFLKLYRVLVKRARCARREAERSANPKHDKRSLDPRRASGSS